MTEKNSVANALAPSWLKVPADANALSSAIWPRTASRVSGELLVGGVGVQQLAKQFGTPLYVVDEFEFRQAAAEVLEAFEVAAKNATTSVSVYYAAKAFLSIDIARWMVDAGLNIDVCSGGELAVVVAAGIDPKRCGFHGNNKSIAEIEQAVKLGVGTIVLDSLQEIDRVATCAKRFGRMQNVRLRVNSGVHASTHAFLATAHEDQKFGITIADAQEAVAQIRAHSSLQFLGLHCHIGSQIFGSDGFAESAARLLVLHRDLLADGPVPELNLGGGFGIAYTEADDPSPISELAEKIVSAVAKSCFELAIPIPKLAFEPGRVIAGRAGVTLYRVGTVKDVEVSIAGSENANRRYISVDGGMSDNARPALYGADYGVRLANRVSDEEAVLVRIAGKHCESGDIVVDADYLPSDVGVDDLLAVPATGAYCWSLASNYNYLGRPAVVAVSGGSARVLIRAETESDLLSRDTAYL